jgi:hypothetical protein
MLFKAFIAGSLTMGAVLGWIMAAGPSVFLGFYKDQFVETYERAGVDMSDCKNARRSLLNPSGGMPNCLRQPMTDLMRRIDESANGSAERSFDIPNEEPPLE